MTVLSKLLVLLAFFLLANHANAFTSLSLVAGDQVWVIQHLIQLQQPMSNPKNEPVENQSTKTESTILLIELMVVLHLRH
jgi:hypothetical protein